jgi:hypothetical protein
MQTYCDSTMHAYLLGMYVQYTSVHMCEKQVSVVGEGLGVLLFAADATSHLATCIVHFPTPLHHRIQWPSSVSKGSLHVCMRGGAAYHVIRSPCAA